MFKTELHCHSKDASGCARIDVDTIVNKFTEGEYTTLVLTNHFGDFTYDYLKAESWDDMIDKYVGAYKKLKECADGKLNILMGMELRFKHNNNDYLVFGPDEEFLKSHPDIFDMKVWEFHKICQEKGYLLIQAHPFRNGMQIVKPELLDGIEIFNGHMDHDSRNVIAQIWAEKFGLKRTAGSDYHYSSQTPNAGMLTDVEVKDISTLVEILKSGQYQLIVG